MTTPWTPEPPYYPTRYRGIATAYGGPTASFMPRKPADWTLLVEDALSQR
jgi:hypothetical protein